ncbi:hypothetical protein VNO78_22906 [Psophocarpus tetragonolobus]|uniref:Uncharacterized protein n=1 Tax=Psophocarpus tetragonolobus TaxID=3891 RepID=A0AAN9S326_PSOTE
MCIALSFSSNDLVHKFNDSGLLDELQLRLPLMQSEAEEGDEHVPRGAGCFDGLFMSKYCAVHGSDSETSV